MYIIKNGNVHIGDGRIVTGCDILTDDRYIKKVGKNLNIPGAKIIDASGKEVFPGFINTVCSIAGMGYNQDCPDNIEATDPFTPELNIKYSIDPMMVDIQEYYKVGITSIGASPDSQSVVGGQMVVFKTSPKMKYFDRILKDSAGLKCSVLPMVKQFFKSKNMAPKSKTGMFYLIESRFDDLNHVDEKDYTTGQKVLKKAKDGELPIFISAASKSEINGAVNVFKDMNVKMNIVDALEFDRCLPQIIRSGAGVVIGDFTACSGGIKHDLDLTKVKDLIDNNVNVAITSARYGTAWDGREVFLWDAIELYRAGIDAEEIIKMLTLNPAKMLGVDNKIGSIEEGKDADITIFSAHPIKTYTARVNISMINGEVVYGG